MKAKQQQPYTSDQDAKEKLIVYVYEYLIHSGAQQAAASFKEAIQYQKEIKVNEGPGFLLDWWCVFWDLYCAAPERRMTQGAEPSNEARAFHDFMRSTPMSPSITQTSPPQQPPPPQFIGAPGPRYAPHMGPRGVPPRMQGPPHPHGPPGGFMPAASPRYAPQHSGPPPPPQHMNQPGPMGFGPGPDQMGPSPGMNRMTPVGGPPPPPQQVVGPPPPNGPPPPPPQIIGMPPGQQMGGPPPGQGPSQMQTSGPPRNGSQGNAGWQGNVNYGHVNSPYGGPGSNQPQQGTTMMMSDGSMMEVKSSPMNGGEPSTPHSEEYVMPVPFGQDTSDQCESAEILKLKQSMQDDTTKMYEKEQEFNCNMGDYSDPQAKWS